MNTEKIKAAIVNMCQDLIAAEKMLQEMDSKVGDGDCGEGFARGGKAIIADVKGYSNDSPVDLLR